MWTLLGAPQDHTASRTVTRNSSMTVAEDDYDAVVQQIRSHGVRVDEVYFGDDPTAPGQRSAYVTDPDGHVVEFWTRT